MLSFQINSGIFEKLLYNNGKYSIVEKAKYELKGFSMRTEDEMYDLILNTAKDDDRIRAVLLNGSRADMSAKKDCFQDYDIVYIVKDLKLFIEDIEWIHQFPQLFIKTHN